MQKLELTINQTMGVITGNFEDIKKSLETEMAVYETKQFAEEDKQKAKGDLADLRKLRKAVNDRKVEVKKEYMKPYEVFEGKVKELIGVIDKPIALIDRQVKEFEAKRVEEKKAEIQDLYNELVEEELHDYMPLEKIYGEKWTNASTTMKSIREEINLKVMQTRQDIATIKAMKSEKEEQALNLYMENNNLALAIQMINRYEQEKAEILRRKEKEEQERRDRELERERERVREEERARIREEERLKAEAEQKVIDQIKTVDEVKAAELTTEDSKTVVFTVKAKLIAEYGQYENINGALVPLPLDDDIDAYNVEFVHLQPTSRTTTNQKGKVFRVNLVMRGSHTYDTDEMSKLIDGTVYEAKELGIETMTPNQISEMKERWCVKIGEKT